MTAAERIRRVQLLCDDASVTDEKAEELLEIANDTVLEVLCPFGIPEGLVIPERYHGVWCELAARYFARTGGRGEVSHSENGISRTWSSSDDRDILSRITPYARVGGSHAVTSAE